MVDITHLELDGNLPIFNVEDKQEGFVIEEDGVSVKQAKGNDRILAPVIEFRRPEILIERPPILSMQIGRLKYQQWKTERIKKLEDAGANEIVILQRIPLLYSYKTFDGLQTFQEAIWDQESILIITESETYAQCCFFGRKILDWTSWVI